MDGPVVIIGGEDIEWVEFLGFGHGSFAGGSPSEVILTVEEGTVNTLVGEGHHWEHSSEIEIEVSVGVEFVLLGLALLSHFVGERGVSLDLVPLSGELLRRERCHIVLSVAAAEGHSSVDGVIEEGGGRDEGE